MNTILINYLMSSFKARFDIRVEHFTSTPEFIIAVIVLNNGLYLLIAWTHLKISKHQTQDNFISRNYFLLEIEYYRASAEFL